MLFYYVIIIKRTVLLLESDWTRRIESSCKIPDILTAVTLHQLNLILLRQDAVLLGNSKQPAVKVMYVPWRKNCWVFRDYYFLFILWPPVSSIILLLSLEAMCYTDFTAVKVVDGILCLVPYLTTSLTHDKITVKYHNASSGLLIY